ncbi:Signal transduction response regulator, receiver domain [Dillenia turbinata]|uniref:Signal transduction response regulator, receiver domain n=1 Tax=Dillenia turbinata TaxID=194707 RepID=A0AAN8V228_9MAGN
MAQNSTVARNQENDESWIRPCNKDRQVLLIDGDKTALVHHKRLLEMCSYRVTATSEVSKALEIFREKKEEFYFVLADAGVPEVNTCIFLETLKRNEVPVIYMAKELETKVMARACSNGACSFLAKPVQLSMMKTLWFGVEKERMTQKKISQMLNYIKMTDMLRKECKAQDMITISKDEVEVTITKVKAVGEGTSKGHQISAGTGNSSSSPQQPHESGIHLNVKGTCINRSYQEAPLAVSTSNQENQQMDGKAEQCETNDCCIVSDQNLLPNLHGELGNSSRNRMPRVQEACRLQEPNRMYPQKRPRMTQCSETSATRLTQRGTNLLNSSPILLQPQSKTRNSIRDEVPGSNQVCSVSKLSEPPKTVDHRNGALNPGVIQNDMTEKGEPAIILSPSSSCNTVPVLEYKLGTKVNDRVQATKACAGVDYTSILQSLQSCNASREKRQLQPNSESHTSISSNFHGVQVTQVSCTRLPQQISSGKDNVMYPSPPKHNNPQQHLLTVGKHETFQQPSASWPEDVISAENTSGPVSYNRQKKCNPPIFTIGDDDIEPVRLGSIALQDPRESKISSEQQVFALPQMLNNKAAATRSSIHHVHQPISQMQTTATPEKFGISKSDAVNVGDPRSISIATAQKTPNNIEVSDVINSMTIPSIPGNQATMSEAQTGSICNNTEWFSGFDDEELQVLMSIMQPLTPSDF